MFAYSVIGITTVLNKYIHLFTISTRCIACKEFPNKTLFYFLSEHKVRALQVSEDKSPLGTFLLPMLDVFFPINPLHNHVSSSTERFIASSCERRIFYVAVLFTGFTEDVSFYFLAVVSRLQLMYGAKSSLKRL